MYSQRSRKFIFFITDIILLFFSLFVTLVIRYGSFPTKEVWLAHQWPFVIIYFIWLIIFYIAGLYDIEKFISTKELRNKIFKTMISAGAVSIIIFYLIPFFTITPKTNLVLNGLIAFILIWIWRRILFLSAVKSSKIKIYFLGKDREIEGFTIFLNERPQLGYSIVNEINLADIIIVSENSKENPQYVQSLYNLIIQGKAVLDFNKFYETIIGKIPVSLISKTWFLENFLEINKQMFEKLKRVIDIIFSLILFVPLIIFYPFIAIAIKINSAGPVLYKQKRVGKNGKIFEIFKFRSMLKNAEEGGVQWAKEKDERITWSGNILRKTRLDELPQIWNVLMGDLSFVGPRPERPEFVKELENKIPHYSMRHIVRPGLSGWAQINFPYGASVEDAMEKMQYDLYYIKNRNLLLEISIILKTIMTILSHSGR
ncbi:MAG: exopolysaccharide biosynthesis polyprenyl glycosylphosphotransferase [Patescibacteria group bacterium]